MAEALAAAGIAGAYEGARKYVTSERLISRTHFARYLVEAGHAKETKDVFKRYLTPGKPGYVAHAWATLSEAVDWIHAAGGQAVIAHPGRYKCRPTGMRRLLGGIRRRGRRRHRSAVAVAHARAIRRIRDVCARFGLRGILRLRLSRSRRELARLGRPARLARGVAPVWKDW